MIDPYQVDISSELIFEDTARALVIQSDVASSANMLDLIGRTTFGSGGTRYLVCDLADKLGPQANAHFISMREHGRLIGSYILIGKVLCIDGQRYPAYYRTLLSLQASVRGRGYGKLLVEKTRAHFLKKLGASGVLYGYIEADNHRSMAVAARAVLCILRHFRNPGTQPVVSERRSMCSAAAAGRTLSNGGFPGRTISGPRAP